MSVILVHGIIKQKELLSKQKEAVKTAVAPEKMGVISFIDGSDMGDIELTKKLTKIGKSSTSEIKLTGMTCLIIGAGGAARAIGFMLKEQDVAVSIVNRSRKRGEELAASLGCPFVPLDEIRAAKGGLLVQTTPVGMYPHIDQCPVPENILEQGVVVMDIVYLPAETRLLNLAKNRGCVIISGVDMLINQGAEQFRLWTDLDPPVASMRHALKEALLENDERN